MAQQKYIFKMDVGTKFYITVTDNGGTAINISTASVKKFYFLKPGATNAIVKDADFVNTGVDGQLVYTGQTGFLDTEGDWTIQPYVEYGSNKFHGEMHTFHVYPVLS